MRALTVLFTVTVACLAGATSAAASADTQTIHFAFTEVSPAGMCDGSPGTQTLTVTGVTHITTLPDGTYHQTTTAQGPFQLVPDAPNPTDQPSYTGHFAFWDGDNYTGAVDETTTTFDVHGRGSDGSNLAFTFVTHETVTPTGVDLRFTRTNFKVNGKRCG